MALKYPVFSQKSLPDFSQEFDVLLLLLVVVVVVLVVVVAK
jgi:hypothetical protein